ncbi:MAG: response regulator [Myxococcales bacterium]|nr:response regulator [Myxococcales bacterium]
MSAPEALAAQQRLDALESERERLESELRRSEARFRELFDTLSRGVVYLDANGTIEDANPAAECILGHSLDELRSRHPLDPRWDALRADGSRCPDAERPSEIARTKGQVVRSAVVGIEHRGGHRVWVQIDAVPRRSEVLPCSVCVTLEDVSVQQEAERAHLELQRRAQQLDRLESLRVLTGGVAHDFNNILTTALGYLELANQDLPPDSPVDEDLGKARESIARATQLSRQMLAASGSNILAVAPSTWQDIVAGQEATLARSIPAHIQLEIVHGEATPVAADAGQLQRVVQQLVTNAVEALGELSGEILVVTGAAHLEGSDEELASSSFGEPLEAGRYATLSVSDTGHGMSEAVLARAFDPFFTTRFAGRGLGLPEALGIVRAHRGTMTIASAPGRGTTVRVLLPSTVKSARVPTPLPAAVEAERVQVLLVDDEPGIGAIAKRVLERAGFTTLVARSGPEAIELFRARAGQVGMVVLDVSMPDMSGAEVFAALRALDPRVRIVMSSGYSEDALARDVEALRTQGFLSKPYTAQRLLEVVRGVLGKG